MLYETKNHPPHRFVDNVDAPQPTEPAAPATREDAPCSDGADSRHGGEAPPTAEQRTPIHPHKHSPTPEQQPRHFISNYSSLTTTSPTVATAAVRESLAGGG